MNPAGQHAEALAHDYLVHQGLALLTRNYRSPYGEIDLIMRHGGSVVYVEVRYRQTVRYGDGADSVDRRKQGRLIATAQHYLQRHPAAARHAQRFDVVAVAPGIHGHDIRWITDAFHADTD